MPSFGFPVVMAIGGAVLLVFTCMYMNYFMKPERPTKTVEKSRRQREASAGNQRQPEFAANQAE